jgi:hypothetical protein
MPMLSMNPPIQAAIGEHASGVGAGPMQCGEVMAVLSLFSLQGSVEAPSDSVCSFNMHADVKHNSRYAPLLQSSGMNVSAAVKERLSACGGDIKGFQRHFETPSRQ